MIDVDGHKSVMKLISEDEPVAFPSEEARRSIETSVFELLSDLCALSKSKRAVVAAEQCDDCIAHAAHVVSSLVEKVAIEGEIEEAVDGGEADAAEEEETDVAEEEDDETEEKDEEEPVEASAPAITYEYKVKSQGSSLELESAALAFLARVVGVEKCRLQLFSESEFMPSLKSLAKDCTSFKLQMQTTTFLANVAPYAKKAESDGTLSTADIAEAFTAVVKLTPTVKSTKGPATENVNSLKTVATKGLGVVLNDTRAELQTAAMEAVGSTFSSLVKKHTTARTASSVQEKANSALLAYNLSSLLVRSTGNDMLWPCLSGADLTKSMVHLVEWRYDTKTVIKGEDQVYWDAAVSNSIQHLSHVICATEERHVSLGVSIKSMVGTVLMLARPGKAPRKTADFPTSLKRAVEAKLDAASVLAAESILGRILD